MREILEDFLKINDVKYKQNVCLKNLSPVRIGGFASVVIYPQNEDILTLLVEFLNNYKISYKILGRMSNTLFKDNFYKDVLIKTDFLSYMSLDEIYLNASAGTSVHLLSKYAMHNGLSGLEEVSGIPGSLGGAIYGNAGAYGKEIGDVISSVRIFDPMENKISHYSREECDFLYRSSVFQNSDKIILSASLKLTKSSEKEVGEKIERFRLLRKQNQPINMPSLGSTFKRTPSGESAAKLIDMCSLRGYSIGGAQISEKHAGFIVNAGNATAENYIALMDLASSNVFDKFGVRLVKEIEIL